MKFNQKLYGESMASSNHARVTSNKLVYQIILNGILEKLRKTGLNIKTLLLDVSQISQEMFTSVELEVGLEALKF